MTYKQVERILKQNGFFLARHKSGSHRHFKATVDGKTRLVTLAYHRINEDIKPNTLAAIIRQSGLDKKLFK